MKIIHAVTIRTQKRIERIIKVSGYFKTFKFLNTRQKTSFFTHFSRGNIDDEIVIEGGREY